MLKNIKPKLIAISIIALITAGTFWYVNYLINKPLDIEIPKEFTYNNTKIALAWTDDNTGENLIIQSDRKEYNGFNEVDVFFSITNISRRDQNMDVVVWVESEKVRVEEVLKIQDTRNKDTNKLQIQNYKSQTNYNNQIPNRKDVGGSNNGYSANDQIESGQTNYYKATIKYPPMSNGEFFIEAFGRKNPSALWASPLGKGRNMAEPRRVPLLAKEGLGVVSAYGHLDPWYSSSYQYKRAITLNASQIATTTDAFPVLATTTLADLKTVINGGKVGNDNGYDIIFVDDDDATLLNFEREYYASTTGEIAYWIKTDISSTTDKVINMYYGNSGASDVSTTTGVWDDNFVMVNHLAHDGVATTTYPDFLDSTQYDNDGSSINMNSDDLVDGQVDGSLDFDGVDDYVGASLVNNDINVSQGTANFWLYRHFFDTTPIDRFYLEIGTNSANTIQLNYRAVTDLWTFLYKANSVITVVTALPANISRDTWTQVIFVWDTTADVTRAYVNGVEVGTPATGLGVWVGAVSNTNIGSNFAGLGNYDGLIDEVRISNVARTAQWIATEYNNQSDVASFLTIGAEESLKLDITTAAKVIVAGTESTAFTVQAQDQDGNAMVMGNAVTVNLASDSSGTHHFAATAAGAAVTTVTIPQGASSVNFYYTDYQPGAPTITVTATNYTQNTQQQMVQGGWYDTGYQCRRRITLDADKIATTTDAFPVLATSTLAEMATVANGGCVANDDGRDIIFVDDDDATLLNYEREKYDPTTGEIAYWIKTDISSTTDKTIYMYYGNSGASDVSTTTGVWDDNFVMVNHLAHDGVATTTYPDFLDSTKYNNDGSSKNMNSADLVDGQVDGSLDFDGVDDYVGTNYKIPIIDHNITISGWFNATKTREGNYGLFQNTQYPSGLEAQTEYIYVGTTQFKIVYSFFAGIVQSGASINFADPTYSNFNKWNHFSIVVEHGGGTINLSTFTNGSLTGNTSTSTSFIANPSGVFNIGRSENGPGAPAWSGLIDEARISNTARTQGWITTEYNNQSDVASFLTIGGEESLSVPATRSGGENVKTRIKGGVIFKGGVRF